MTSSRKSVTVLRRWTLVVIVSAGCLLTACDDQGTSNNAKTPPPTATFTPAPSDAVVLPMVESGSGPSGDQVSPLATPDSASPLPTPAPTP